MSGEGCYDVAIAGGGLAGLCLSIQLKRAHPSAALAVFERRCSPMPLAAFKVGESSVEVGSHYFRVVLGLADELRAELPKFGLRFFFTAADNRDIATRFECGPGRFLTVPSFQIDRGRFENALAQRARDLGVEVFFGSEIRDVKLSACGDPHSLTAVHGSGAHRVRSRWFVDATGRAGLLKREVGLARPNAHRVNAAWFRLDAEIDLDAWSGCPDYRARLDGPRRLSTNHLMGEGYWVWVIPLSGGRTSLGIVADASLHPFAEISRFDRAMGWLEKHEPQLAAELAPHLARRMDFLALKDFSYGCKTVFGRERWCISGDAGLFVDPFYSPGSDFIAMSNGFIADLVARDLAGESVDAIAARYDRTYTSIYRAMLSIYESQYPIMGNARVMSLKIIWDFVMYWGGIALLNNHGKLCDGDFMARARRTLNGFAVLGVGMQRFLRRWSRADASKHRPPHGFLDYSSIDFLARLNRALLEPADDESLLQQLEENLALAKRLDREIREQGARLLAGEAATCASPEPRHLGRVFHLLWSEPDRAHSVDPGKRAAAFGSGAAR